MTQLRNMISRFNRLSIEMLREAQLLVVSIRRLACIKDYHDLVITEFDLKQINDLHQPSRSKKS